MIAKDYFKRQATTLRKMVRVTRNRTLANHLTLMANDFDSRSGDGTEEIPPPVGAAGGVPGGEENHD
jgi:hypothetical protein